MTYVHLEAENFFLFGPILHRWLGRDHFSPTYPILIVIRRYYGRWSGRNWLWWCRVVLFGGFMGGVPGVKGGRLPDNSWSQANLTLLIDTFSVKV